MSLTPWFWLEKYERITDWCFVGSKSEETRLFVAGTSIVTGELWRGRIVVVEVQQSTQLSKVLTTKQISSGVCFVRAIDASGSRFVYGSEQGDCGLALLSIESNSTHIDVRNVYKMEPNASNLSHDFNIQNFHVKLDCFEATCHSGMCIKGSCFTPSASLSRVFTISDDGYLAMWDITGAWAPVLQWRVFAHAGASLDVVACSVLSGVVCWSFGLDGVVRGWTETGALAMHFCPDGLPNALHSLRLLLEEENGGHVYVVNEENRSVFSLNSNECGTSTRVLVV